MKKISIIGLDIAKVKFEACAQDERGKTIERKKLNRGQVLTWFDQQESCFVGMEACGGAHYWAREITKRGHTVRIVPPQYVKPYVVRNKSDRHDARAIAQALRDPEVPCVSIATAEQQDIQVLHRLRSRCIRERTALVNQLRGFLLEYGIALPKRVDKARAGFQALIAEASGALSVEFRGILEEQVRELRRKDEKIEAYTKKIEETVKTDPSGERVQGIPGIGPLIASALLLKVRHESIYRNGRHLAASLGLVPRHEGTGGHLKLGRISKRGDRYVRTLLIHGARSIVARVGEKNDFLSRWIRGLVNRRGTNKAVVALANKNARMAWRIIVKEEIYNPDKAMARYRHAA